MGPLQWVTDPADAAPLTLAELEHLAAEVWNYVGRDQHTAIVALPSTIAKIRVLLRKAHRRHNRRMKMQRRRQIGRGRW